MIKHIVCFKIKEEYNDEVEEGYVVSQTPEYRNDMCHHCTPLDIIYHLLWSLGYSIVMHHSALRMPIPSLLEEAP